MVVVSDTSPITNLIHIGSLDILKIVFGTIVVPISVYDELSKIPKQKILIDNQDWISIEIANNLERVALLKEKLDIGESEAIVLALELSADFLIIDEIKGRNIATDLGVKIVGLVGVLLKAKQQGAITKVKPILEQLTSLGFRLQPDFYRQLLHLANE